LQESNAAETPAAGSLPLADTPAAWMQTLLRSLQPALRQWSTWSLILALAAGLALRMVWVAHFQDFDDDSAVYATIAKNMMVHQQYALDNPYHLTLIRMPGYPAFMAVVFAFFGMKNYNAVCWVQAFVDMGTCLLLAGFVRDHAGRRAALVTLWIACLCPFTANYAAIPLTECPEIFFVALGMFATGRLVASINSQSGWRRTWFALTVAALIGAIAMRPDGVLLAGAIVAGIWWYTRKTAPKVGFQSAAWCAVLAFLPLVPWTIRNYRVYHVFEPLAPRSAMDPIEQPLEGFNLWFTTWEVDFVSVGEIWWRGDSETLDIHLIPSRAFDTPQEYQETAQLINEYNQVCSISPEFDARFEAIAEQRIRRHPLRQYVELPLARLADMWLRPRIEYLNDAIPERWWEWSKHPAKTVIAGAYALLNLLLLIAAVIGFARRKVPLQAMLLFYVLMRCAILLKMPNAEPRYTLEAFPMAMVAAGIALTKGPAIRPSGALPS
jgi:4-amino-4-deoxy-L-arabinose transferase-like glycosyltransferase